MYLYPLSTAAARFANTPKIGPRNTPATSTYTNTDNATKKLPRNTLGRINTEASTGFVNENPESVTAINAHMNNAANDPPMAP